MDMVRTFAETTSMKGVPRIMKAKFLPIRILWVLSVLGLLCISMRICITLVQQYLQRPKAIQIKDINAFKLDDDHEDLFSLPGVTVCNQNPLTAYNGHDGISWQQYLDMVSPLVENETALRGRYMSPRRYLEYIGPEAVVKNEAAHDFVTECNIGTLEFQTYTCNSYEWNATYFPNVKYSQCYTFSFDPDTLVTSDVLSLTLYLDEVNAQMVEYSSEMRATRGVAVIIHAPGQLPTFENAEFAAAGQLTTFKVRKTLYERLPNSDDPCKDSTVSTDVYDMAGTRHSYSQMGCTFAVLQKATLEACGCINSDFIVLPANRSLQGLHFCGAVTENYTQMSTEIQCVGNIITDSILDEIVTSCIVPCNETFHSVSVTSSPWPTETAQLSFYKHVIKHKSFGEYFKAYDGIYNDYMATSDANKAMEELEKLSLIEKNFAKIDIILPGVRGDLYKVVYQMSFESLLASIGGNLNLWSGISVIILIELVDLFIKLLFSTLKRRPSHTVTTVR